MSSLYLALTDGVTTLALTDQLNYTLDEGGGAWMPQLAIDEDQRTIVETLVINVLGATSIGGVDDPYRVRRNLTALVTMLRQIERGQWGDGNPVVLDYTTPNSSPQMVLAAMVTRWDATTFLPSINSAVNLVSSTVNQVTLVIERRVKWVLRNYAYDNLLTGSAWITNPNWVGSPAGGQTFVNAALPAGGSGYIQDVVPAFTTRTLTAPTTQTFSVVSGQTYTVFFRAAISLPIQIGSIRLRNAADSADISAVVSLAGTTITNASIIGGGGQVVRAVIVATATDAQARLRLQYSSTSVAVTFQFGEFLVLAGDVPDDAWHTRFAELTSAATTAAQPINALVTLPASAALADTKITVTGVPGGAAYPTALGEVVAVVGTPASIMLNYPNGVMSGPFTAVADTAAWASNGSVMRFTAAVAGAWNGEPLVGLTMIDAMGAGVSLGSLRMMRIMLVARNNSATATFSVYVQGYAAQNNPVVSRIVDIPPNGTKPIHIILPMIAHPEGFYDFRLQLSGSIAGQSLDIDRVWAIGMNEETTIHRSVPTFNMLQTGTLIYDPQTLTAPKPGLFALVTASGYTPAKAAIASVDYPFIRSRSGSLRVIVDALSDGKWQMGDTAAVALQAVVSRPLAFDNPV